VAGLANCSQHNDGSGQAALLARFQGREGKWSFEMPENMTLRDWFAGMALQGLLASGELASGEAGPAGVKDAAARPNAFVAQGYFYADSMLAKKKRLEMAQQGIDDEEEDWVLQNRPRRTRRHRGNDSNSWMGPVRLAVTGESGRGPFAAGAETPAPRNPPDCHRFSQ
jgi:hypothetical protein